MPAWAMRFSMQEFHSDSMVPNSRGLYFRHLEAGIPDSDFETMIAIGNSAFFSRKEGSGMEILESGSLYYRAYHGRAMPIAIDCSTVFSENVAVL